MLPAAHAKRGRSCRRQGFFHMGNIVNSFNSLYKAYRKTRCGKRDNPTAMRYRMEAIERTADLSDRLQRREYTFGPYYPFKVYEPKERLVLAIDFEGKVVQHSLCDNVLEPVFSRRFIRDNYAGQIGKGTHDGLDRLADAMRHHFFSRKAADEEARRAAGLPYRPMEEWDYAEGWVLKGDFSKFFYTLLHAVCFEKARKALAFLSDEELIDFVEWLLWIVIDSTPDPGIPSATSRANCSPCSIWTTSTTGCGMTSASSMAVTWMTSTSSAATSCCSGRSSSESRSTSSRWACA